MVGAYYQQEDINTFRNVTYGTQTYTYSDTLVTLGLSQAIAAAAIRGVGRHRRGREAGRRLLRRETADGADGRAGRQQRAAERAREQRRAVHRRPSKEQYR